MVARERAFQDMATLHKEIHERSLATAASSSRRIERALASLLDACQEVLLLDEAVLARGAEVLLELVRGDVAATSARPSKQRTDRSQSSRDFSIVDTFAAG